MENIDITEKVALGNIFSIPGEGLVIELNYAKTSYLYDKQGLKYRIIKKQQLGLDSTVEQMALSRINNIGSNGYD